MQIEKTKKREAPFYLREENGNIKLPYKICKKNLITKIHTAGFMEFITPLNII